MARLWAPLWCTLYIAAVIVIVLELFVA